MGERGGNRGETELIWSDGDRKEDWPAKEKQMKTDERG